MPKNFVSRIVLTATSNASKVLGKAGRSAGRLGDKLVRVGGEAAKAGGFVAAAFAGNAIREAANFEAALSNLSAITGATGKDLDFLAQASKRMGQTTTLTASQAAEAFKLVASAKPDLLGNAEALETVTQQAVLLAEASGTTLPEAARTVGEAMNQFGASADQAARFVNVLAAGSKRGSSEVEDTAAALVNAGVAAKGAGVNFEETNALIQTLATVGIKGADAGTKLRSALVNMQITANDKFNPAVVGMQEALDNMAEANLTVTEKLEIFGKKNLVVADALINNREKFGELTTAITGTNVAVIQAAINNDNLKGDTKRLSSAFEALSINVGENWLPVVRDVVTIATAVINQFAGMAEASDEVDVEFSTLDKTVRVMATTFSAAGAIFEGIGKTLGAVAAAVVSALSGEFGEIPDIFDELKNDLENIGSELGNTAFEIINTETPERIRAKFDEEIIPPVVDGAKRTAEMAAAAALSAGTAAADAEKARALQSLQTKLEDIRRATLTEQEMMAEDLAVRLEILTEGLIAKEITEDEFRERKLLLETAMQEKLTKMEKKALTDRQKFEAMTNSAKAKHVFATLESVTAGVATQSKAMFRINQAAAIANAIMNTSEGITKALSMGPWGIPLAGVIAAAGAVQIATIASAKPGGGTTPSVSASTPSFQGQPVPGTPPPTLDGAVGGGQVISISIDGLNEGGLMSTSATRELIESINEQLGDGVDIDTGDG